MTVTSRLEFFSTQSQVSSMLKIAPGSAYMRSILCMFDVYLMYIVCVRALDSRSLPIDENIARDDDDDNDVDNKNDDVVAATPLHLAAWSLSAKVIALLLKRGASNERQVVECFFKNSFLTTKKNIVYVVKFVLIDRCARIIDCQCTMMRLSPLHCLVQSIATLPSPTSANGI
jgi:hypothetical protein